MLLFDGNDDDSVKAEHALSSELRAEKCAHGALGARRGVGVKFHRHAIDPGRPDEIGIVEPVARAGIDDEFELGAALALRLRQSLAIRGRRDRVGRADENEGRDLQGGARTIFAGRVEGDGGLESQRLGRCIGCGDLERGVRALGIADDRDAPAVDVAERGEISQCARGVGETLAEISRRFLSGRGPRNRLRRARHSPSGRTGCQSRRDPRAGRGRNAATRRRETVPRRAAASDSPGSRGAPGNLTSSCADAVAQINADEIEAKQKLTADLRARDAAMSPSTSSRSAMA